MVGFYGAVREFIVHRLAGTFEKVSTASLGQTLRLEGTSLENLVRLTMGRQMCWLAGRRVAWSCTLFHP